MKFTCGYCGKEYPTISERMQCERKCYEKKIQEEEDLMISEREKEMNKDYDFISSLVKERDALDKKISDVVTQYNKKYYGAEISTLNQLFPDPMHWFYF